MEEKMNMNVSENAIFCPHDSFCGGCVYGGMDYNEQLAVKEQEVNDLIDRKKLKIGKKDRIQAAPSISAYRNKMEYTFGNLVKDGELTLGMHKKGHYMSIITVDECQLVCEDFNRVLRAVLEFATERGLSHYHKKTHKGLLRNLVIRKGERTGELLINIVTSGEDGFDEEAFTETILGLPLDNSVAGIVRTINDDLADAVKCDNLKILYGRDHYFEEILGLKFRVSPFSFFQTNISAVEELYREAIDLIDGLEGKTVFDLFCGTGTISQAMALRADKVIGVEIVEEAVASARENAQMNGLENCSFIAGDVFRVMDEIEDRPDVIVVDPPRMGISPKALDKIIRYGVDQIVYISCNPKTMVENLYYMEYNGYDVKYLKPFDNFPNTKHIECICLLEKRKA